MAATFTLKNKDFIIKGLEALAAASDGDSYDVDSLDLADFDRNESKAFKHFVKSHKGNSFKAAKLAFKEYCLGTIKVHVPHVEAKITKVVEDDTKVSKVVAKEPKAGAGNNVSDPIIHDGHGDIEVNMKKGTVELFAHPLMTFRHELLKRKECYEINFKWVTVKGHTLTDKVLVPHKSAASEQALKLWITKIARKLVLVYLSPYTTMPHPADSQGIINAERTW